MMKTFLLCEFANEQQSVVRACFAWVKEAGHHGHRRDDGIRLGRQSLRLAREPGRDGRQRVGRPGDEAKCPRAAGDVASEAYVGPMECRHERSMRERAYGAADNTARKPPVRVYEIELSNAHEPQCFRECGR